MTCICVTSAVWSPMVTTGFSPNPPVTSTPLGSDPNADDADGDAPGFWAAPVPHPVRTRAEARTARAGASRRFEIMQRP